MQKIAAESSSVEAIIQRGLASTPRVKRKPVNCEQCADSGWLPIIEPDGTARVKHCPCQTPEIRLTRAGLGVRHSTAKLEDFQNEVIVFGRKFTSGTGVGVLIRGSVGAGKTHLMAAICREFIMRGVRIRFIMASELFRRIWACYREHAAETPDQMIEDFSLCPVLAIDDLGKGKVSDAELRVFHEIISKRNDNARKTIVTTNLTSDDIAEVYDPSIRSRLSVWTPLVMTGYDRRRDKP